MTDRDLRRRLSASLPLLLSQGRAPGVVVVAAVQDPRKETLPFRDLFPVRVALRLVEAEQVDLALGDGAHDKGARCEDIPVDQPGTGYVLEDGSSEPVRVRACWPDDAEIARTVARFSLALADRGDLPAVPVLAAMPPRPELPAPVGAEIAEVLQRRGLGHLVDLDTAARRRRRNPRRWRWGCRRGLGGPAGPGDGWVPDLADHGNPWSRR